MSNTPDIIFRYFPALSERQRCQFAALGSIYEEWNARINLISHSDIGFLYERHILHSLAITKCALFTPCSTVLDIGTGGGFPGVPLAIMFPQTHFTLVDSIGKKIMAVQEIATSLNLQNIDAVQMRAENLRQKFDFAVCRAVAPLRVLLTWIGGKINNGAFFLKGGELSGELMAVQRPAETFEINQWFEEDYFAEKKVVSIKFNVTVT